MKLYKFEDRRKIDRKYEISTLAMHSGRYIKRWINLKYEFKNLIWKKNFSM